MYSADNNLAEAAANVMSVWAAFVESSPGGLPFKSEAERADYFRSMADAFGLRPDYF